MQNRNRRSALLGIAAACLAVAATASPDPQPETTPAAPGAPREATAQDLAILTGANPYPVADDTDIAVVTHADGSKSAIVDESFMAVSVARIGPDGQLITGCVTSRAEYDAFFAADAPALIPEVR